MSNYKNILLLNATSLTLSLSDIEQILQIIILVVSGIISVIASIRELTKSKDNDNN
jgi:hypothetical protein